MAQAFDEGWGGVICKTLSLDSKKVVNVTPRYAKLRDTAGKVFGWQVTNHMKTTMTLRSHALNMSPSCAQNFELISDRPFETMLAELKRLKKEYPDRVLIASIMVIKSRPYPRGHDPIQLPYTPLSVSPSLKEEYNKESWAEIIGRCEEVGVDAFEINFSCPHGMPERKVGGWVGTKSVYIGMISNSTMDKWVWIFKLKSFKMICHYTPFLID